MSKTGWLVELDWLVKPKDPPMWWTGIKWTTDSCRALLFSTKEAAEAYVSKSKLDPVKVTEHEWMD